MIKCRHDTTGVSTTLVECEMVQLEESPTKIILDAPVGIIEIVVHTLSVT